MRETESIFKRTYSQTHEKGYVSQSHRKSDDLFRSLSLPAQYFHTGVPAAAYPTPDSSVAVSASLPQSVFSLVSSLLTHEASYSFPFVSCLYPPALIARVYMCVHVYTCHSGFQKENATEQSIRAPSSKPLNQLISDRGKSV